MTADGGRDVVVKRVGEERRRRSLAELPVVLQAEHMAADGEISPPPATLPLPHILSSIPVISRLTDWRLL